MDIFLREAFSYLLLFLTGRLPCIFKEITGFYCPGCGGTRSVLALCSGNVIKSFLLHPFVPVFLIELFIVVLRRIKTGKLFISNPETVIVFSVLILQWIVKNAFLLAGIDIIALANAM